VSEGWLDDLSFVVGPPQLSMGLRALGDEPWLVADEAHRGGKKDVSCKDLPSLAAAHRAQLRPAV
jgi:hypothetical protein